MNIRENITVIRDCDATLIPSGEKVVIKKGEKVMITQSLGDNYTLLLNGNLVQLSGKDADALGMESEKPKQEETLFKPGETLNEQLLWEQMKTCYDPEIPVNIVDLGLIYSCDIFSLDHGGNLVEIKMTLTAPGCGMGTIIADEVRNKILNLPGVSECDVRLVWEPQWNQGMMSEAARLQLGML